MSEASTPLWSQGPLLPSADDAADAATPPVDPQFDFDQPLLPRSRRRRWPWFLLAALTLSTAGGATVWRHAGASSKVTFETAKVDRGRIVVQVTATGTVSALKTVLVGSQVSGRIAELHADFNDTVKKDQLLARIDTQLFKSAVEQARASAAVARSSVTKAEAQLRDADRQLTRQKALEAAKVLAPELVETALAADEVAKAALEGAKAQALQAAAQLHQAELNLAMTAIYSPIDGVVISRSVDVGQTVAASLQAPTVFTLAEDLRKMEVEAHVAEGDVARLAPGMDVSFTVDAFGSRKFAGKLRQVRNAATTVQSVVTYDAIVDVDNPELQLRPGMTANVSFVVSDRTDVLRIPNAALRFRPSREALAHAFPEMKLPSPPPGMGTPGAGNGGAAARRASGGSPAGARALGGGTGLPPSDRKMVFAMAGTAPHPTRVRIGVTDGSFTELVEGDLQEGAALITDLSDGSAPKPTGSAQGMGPGGPMGGPMMGGPPGGGRPGGGRP